MSPIIRTVREQIRPADIDRLVTVLAEGGVVVAPADTVYGLIGKAFDRSVFSKLDRIKRERRLPYAVVFSSLKMLEDWYGGLGIRARRLAQILLPGPVTLILKSNDRAGEGFRYGHAGIGVRVSSDQLLPVLAFRLGMPLWATSANRSNETAPNDFISINRKIIQAVDMAIDAGPTTFRDASTVIDLRTPDFKIKRNGPWLKRVEQAIIKSQSPIKVLLVCSGNTCRSPIAAAFLKKELDEKTSEHIIIESGGLDAIPDMPPSREMVDIAFDWGMNISEHRACQVSVDLLHQFDLILYASPDHKQRMINLEPRTTRKLRSMAEPLGEDLIPDPYKLGGDAYRQTAEMIRTAMQKWAVMLSKIVEDEFGLESLEASKNESTQSANATGDAA